MRNNYPTPTIDYQARAVWEQSAENKKKLKKAEKYWFNKLKGELPVLNLPTDKPRPLVQTYNGAIERITLNVETAARLNFLARKTDTTLFTLLFAIFNVLLHRLTGQEDIIVGTPSAGRKSNETNNVVGIFLNNLALRSDLSGNPVFVALLERIRRTVAAAADNDAYPFERLVEKLNPERDRSRPPLFSAMFQYDDTPDKPFVPGGLKTDYIDSHDLTAKFDLKFRAGKMKNGGLSVLAEYNTDIFYSQTIKNFLEYYRILLQNIVKNSSQKISELEILPRDKKFQLLREWNRTETEYPKHETLNDLFERQAKKTPRNVAVEFSADANENLTYRELNGRANRLARYLKDKKKISSGQVVGIHLKRSVGSIIAELAVLKAGGVCLPIDADCPAERRKYMLKDSRARIIITRNPEYHQKSAIVNIDNKASFDGYRDTNLGNHDKSTGPAYLMYTSGSTGRPKGVRLSHRGSVNQCWHRSHKMGVSSKDIFAHTVSTAFVSSIPHWFVPLGIGAKVMVYPEDVIRDPYRLFQAMDRDGVTMAEVIASTLRSYLVRAGEQGTIPLKRLRHLLVSGEQTIPDTVNRFFSRYKHIKLTNGCGQCECSALTLSYTFPEPRTDYEHAPIGRPLSNTRVYVLDRNLKPVPPGCIGELCVAGEGLALGYLNNPEKTNQAFPPNPFNKESRPAPVEEDRIYRTGDLVRMLSDRNLEYVSRIDHQIKIRGYRVEPGEIETRLAAGSGIKECRVFPTGNDPDGTLLAAYYTGRKTGTEELQSRLKAVLPDYMVPAYFIHLKRFPLNASGKVDRKALPVPRENDLARKRFEKPQGATEVKLAAIWQSVLNIKQISRHDNFFDLGGHSLQAIRLFMRINKDFEVDYSLKDVFLHPILSELAVNLNAQQKISPTVIPSAPRRKFYPLSYAQNGMWVLYKLEPGSPFYNLSHIREITGSLDTPALTKACQILVSRHEALRTNFRVEGDNPVQIIREDADFKLKILDLSKIKNRAKRKNEAEETIEKYTQTPFKLESEPLYRFTLIKTAPNTHIFTVVLHHIISDGWSLEIFWRELARIYQAQVNNQPLDLPALSIQYKDYAAWEQSAEYKQRIKKQKKYWLKELSGELPVLNLPADKPRPPIQTYRGSTEGIIFDFPVAENLRALSRQTDVTMFTLLFAIFNVFLYRITGQEDIIVGTPGEGRKLSGLNDIIGLFLNNLSLRIDLAGDPVFSDLLRGVKRTVIGAADNNEFSFEQLIEKLNLKRDLSRSPVFNIMFQLDPKPEQVFDSVGLKIVDKIPKDETAKFDLRIYAREAADSHIVLTCQYNTDIFHPETIQNFLSIIKAVAEDVCRHPEKKISALEIMDKREKQKLLDTRNNTHSIYPKTKTLHKLFEDQAKKTPNNIAIQFGDQTSTYEELNRKANRLAHTLIDQNIKPESIIGIMIERSPEMVIGILACLKAGCAYLPIDPDYPSERIEYFLTNSRINIILSQKEQTRTIPKNIRIIDIFSKESYADDTDNPGIIVKSNNLAYVMYTSGSSGRPKGVAVEHRSVVNYLTFFHRRFKLGKNDTVLQIVPFSFDPSVRDVFLPLTRGSKMCLTSHEDSKDPQALARLIREKNITCITSIVPTMLNEITDCSIQQKIQTKNLRAIFTCGEILRLDLYDKVSAVFYRQA